MNLSAWGDHEEMINSIGIFTNLKVLDLCYLRLGPRHMAIIESLPQLEELNGYYPKYQKKDTILDNLFAARGKTLKKLRFTVINIDIPRALLQQNNVLVNLVIEYNSFSDSSISPASIIKMCNTKQKGFNLRITGADSSRINVDDYIEIVKSCPYSVIYINVDTKSDKFKEALEKVFNNS